MKLWIEKRNEFNKYSKKFQAEYFIMMQEETNLPTLLFISDSLDDAEYMFGKIAEEIKPAEKEIIKEITL